MSFCWWVGKGVKQRRAVFEVRGEYDVRKGRRTDIFVVSDLEGAFVTAEVTRRTMFCILPCGDQGMDPSSAGVENR
jgi:hypothetical protein